MAEDINMQIEHTKILGELATRVGMLEKVFSLTEGLQTKMVEMSGDSKAILLRLEQQGDDLKVMVTTLKAHEARFDRIEEKMGSKEIVDKLCDRVDTLEKKDGKNAEKTLSQIKWLLITLLVGAIFTVAWTALTGKPV